jgi:hypothetical protein
MLPLGRTNSGGIGRAPAGGAFARMQHLRKAAGPRAFRVGVTLLTAGLLLAWMATMNIMFGAKIRERLGSLRAWELLGGGGKPKKKGADKSARKSGSSSSSSSSSGGGVASWFGVGGGGGSDSGRTVAAASAMGDNDTAADAAGGGGPVDEHAWKRRNFAPRPAWPPESTVQCAMWGTWTEACYYENVCFDAHERVLLFWKDADSPGTGIPPGGAVDWAAGEGTFADISANPGAYDAAAERDPSLLIPAYSPKRVHVSHNDLLTGQVLPLAPFPRYGPARPKLFPFNGNMKGRFMERGEASFYWTRTAAEWARQRGVVDDDVLPPQEELPLHPSEGAGRDGIPLSQAAAQRVVLGAPLPGASNTVPSGRGGKKGATSNVGVSAPFPGEDPDAPVDDTALVLSHKVQLQNIWYYSSRLTPWFEARRLNASGMLPFLLPQPAVAYLGTTEGLVGSDWHRSMFALAAGFPKDVLFPGVFPPGSSSGAAQDDAAAGGGAAPAAHGGRGGKKAALSRPSRSPRPAPTVVAHPNGARYWNGDRVPKLLYRAPIPGKGGLLPQAPSAAGGGGGGGAAPATGGGGSGSSGGDADGADTDGDDSTAAAAVSELLADEAPSVADADGETAAAAAAAIGRLLLEEEAAAAATGDDGAEAGAALAGDFLVQEDEAAIAEEEAKAAARAAAEGGGGGSDSTGEAPAAPPAKAASKPVSAAAPPKPAGRHAVAGGGREKPATRTPAPSPLPRHAPEERTRCYRKLVLTGASGFVFGDTHAASEFRHAALVAVGRGQQPKFVGPGVGRFYHPHLPPRKGEKAGAARGNCVLVGYREHAGCKAFATTSFLTLSLLTSLCASCCSAAD